MNRFPDNKLPPATQIAGNDFQRRQAPRRHRKMDGFGLAAGSGRTRLAPSPPPAALARPAYSVHRTYSRLANRPDAVSEPPLGASADEDGYSHSGRIQLRLYDAQRPGGVKKIVWADGLHAFGCNQTRRLMTSAKTNRSRGSRRMTT